jgi:NAD(P)-dependent dehydrogenase (short-subunit alcohol dehydrogenase family)
MADASKTKPVAAVIGVGLGLGAALARRFARDYVVAVSARSADYLKSLGSEIKALGGSSLEVPADVSDRVSSRPPSNQFARMWVRLTFSFITLALVPRAV